MVIIRARTFCCCLPVRLGIFAVTILGLLVGGALSIAGWLEVKHMTQSPLSRQAEIALCLQSVMFTLLGLISIFGFVAISFRRKKTNLLFAYGTMLFVHLLGNIGSGSFTLSTLFREDVLECVTSPSKQCETTTTTVQATVTVFFIVMWLFQFYGVVLVANFVEEAGERQPVKETPRQPPNQATKNVDASASFPVTTYNSFAGTSYPFTKPPTTYDAPAHTMV